MSMTSPEDDFLLLVSKEIAGNITDVEKTRLMELLQNDEYKEQYFHINAFMKADDAKNNVKDAFDTVLNKIKIADEPSGKESEKNKKSLLRKISSNNRLRAIAAILVLVIACSWLFIHLSKPSVGRPASTAIQSATNYQVIINSQENRKDIVLKDGTKVCLRIGSILKYNEDYGKESREIILEGEGFFDVAKNEKIPLLIHAGNIDVKVLGTSFNIEAYPNDQYVSTTLITGKVNIINKVYPENVIQLKPNQKLIVRNNIKNERSLADTLKNLFSQPYVIKTLEVEPSSALIPELSWMNRKLVFNKEPFEEIAIKMEHWYNVKFYFEDKALQEQLYTGVFEKETLKQALNALKISYPFNYKIEDKKVFITSK